MLHDDMTLARLMVYAQSIEESKLNRMSRKLKRSGPSDIDQPRFKKRSQAQDGSSAPNSNLRKEVVLKMASLLVLLVERSIMGIIYGVPRVALVVVRMDLR